MSENKTETGEQTSADEPIVARAGRYYRNARYIMFVIILGFGVWFLHDGYVKYPAENKAYDAISAQISTLEAQDKRSDAEYLRLSTERKAMTHHEPFDIVLQKILGFVLPPVGVGLLIFWLRRSRGEIRLENGILTAPGHPQIPLKAVDDLDKALWERKGIALAYYRINAVEGILRLDDFVYQAQPIRDIVKRIDTELKFRDTLAEKAASRTDSSAA